MISSILCRCRLGEEHGCARSGRQRRSTSGPHGGATNGRDGAACRCTFCWLIPTRALPCQWASPPRHHCFTRRCVRGCLRWRPGRVDAAHRTGIAHYTIPQRVHWFAHTAVLSTATNTQHTGSPHSDFCVPTSTCACLSGHKCNDNTRIGCERHLKVCGGPGCPRCADTRTKWTCLPERR